VDDCKCAGSSQGAELFPEVLSVLAGRYRVMVERVGVERDLVPATDSVYTHTLLQSQLAQSSAMTAREALPPNHRAEAEDKSKHCSSCYPAVTPCGHIESLSILQQTFAILPVETRK
jgi:hypothetical protein